MLHDPISDFLTRIRNAKEQKHGYVDMPLSKAKENIAKVLLEQGFVKDVLTNKEKQTLRVVLRYAKDRKSVVNGLKRISKPGLRRYIGHADIPRILGGLGIAILSTNKGIIEGEAARKEKLGGELLCYIW
ncbi:MAG: 30S ribosomal protein S8 [Simkaniaceae bacterium]|nr:30S ribosomal protein S8 [Candidatus Sacchlamyda saccharinae]